MEMIKITNNHLKGEGERVLAVGLTTDEDINFYGWGDSKKLLKFVVCKGYINDWCIYLEAMDREMTHKKVEEEGNKITIEMAKKLIDCSEKVLARYRI